MEKGSCSSAGANGGPGSLHGLSLGLTGGGPGKKGRAGLMQRCQVEGCKVDLSDAKAYYSRHRVCGVHSKTPMVIVAGIEQRFCQQCSRFHQLTEFDQGKRSCRRRLAGHNERRRKPAHGSKKFRPSVFDNNHISKSRGSAMDFSSYPSFLMGRELFPDSASERGSPTNRAAITGKYEFPWQSNSPQNPLSDLLTCRPSYSVSPVVSSQECFNGVSDSSNALSLLSNQPWAGPKSRLDVNGQPSDDNPGSSIGHFVCSPWNLGLGQASQPSNDQCNGGLGLSQQSVVQFGELDQTREFGSPPVGQHMHRSL